LDLPKDSLTIDIAYNKYMIADKWMHEKIFWRDKMFTENGCPPGGFSNFIGFFNRNMPFEHASCL
jgi:hypothetical protein